jgi:hypothetical protein
MVKQDRTQAQLAEALGPVNRYFCSQHFCCEVSHPDRLLEYFVKSGGATDFARRWTEAMGSDNKWYCSEHYRHRVDDPRVLWNYYMTHSKAREDKLTAAELSVAG